MGTEIATTTGKALGVASVEQRERRLMSWLARRSEGGSIPEQARTDGIAVLTLFDQRLRRADRAEMLNELTPILALVSPAGMGQDDREEWIDAARRLVGHLPPQLLRRGALAAGRTCDHPAKIIPAILAETDAAYRDLRRDRAAVAGLLDEARGRPWERPMFDPESRCTAEDAKQIMAECEIPSGLEKEEKRRAPLQMPTVEAYVEMGMDRDEAEKAVASQSKIKAPRQPRAAHTFDEAATRAVMAARPTSFPDDDEEPEF